MLPRWGSHDRHPLGSRCFSHGLTFSPGACVRAVRLRSRRWPEPYLASRLRTACLAEPSASKLTCATSPPALRTLKAKGSATPSIRNIPRVPVARSCRPASCAPPSEISTTRAGITPCPARSTRHGKSMSNRRNMRRSTSAVEVHAVRMIAPRSSPTASSSTLAFRSTSSAYSPALAACCVTSSLRELISFIADAVTETFRAISAVAAPCCSTAAAIDCAIEFTSLIVASIPATAATAVAVAFRTSPTC